MQKLDDHLKFCPQCHGRGRVNWILGSLRCGTCGGAGVLDLRKPQDTVSQIQRTVRKGRSE